MVSEIGKFKSIGEITKIFFNSLGITKEKFKRIKSEKDIDLEDIDIKIDEYFNELENNTSKIIFYDDKKKIYQLNKNIIKYLRKNFFEFKSLYIEAVKGITIGVNQEEVDKEVCISLFYPFLDKIIIEIFYNNKEYFYFDNIINPNYYDQIKKRILNILGKDNFTFLIEDKDYYSSKANYIKIQNLGENFHSNDTLNEIVELFLKINIKIEKEKLECSLFFARFYINFKQEISGISNEKAITKINRFDLEYIRQKMHELFIKIQINEENKNFKVLLALEDYLIANQKEKFFREYQKINQEEIILKYYLYYLYSEYLIDKRRYEEALVYLELALNEVEYRGGTFLEEIINKGLIVSSILEIKKSFKRFLKKAIFYNIVSSNYKNCGDWLFEHYKKNLDLSTNIFTVDTSNEIELNIKKPNLKIEYWGRVRSQLEIFSSLPSYGNKVKEELYQDNIKRLLKKGANINFINSTGETPLIRALCAKNYERALILLEDKNISKSINQHSLRKNNTALSVLLENINFNKTEVIKKVLRKLIENNININEKVIIENISPIYLVLALYFKENNLSDFPSILENKSDIEKIRKHINFLDKSILTDEEIRCFYNKVLSKSSSFLKYYNDKNKKMKNFFLEILEILLENGADINLVHEELQGYTPFLFSIEIGDLDVFKLFCKYNPNINQKNISFMGPLEIALVYNHFELFKKLTIKYSFKEYDTLEKVLMLLYYTYGINKDYNLSYDKIKNYLWDFILKTNLNIFEKERLYFILKRSC